MLNITECGKARVQSREYQSNLCLLFRWFAGLGLPPGASRWQIYIYVATAMCAAEVGGVFQATDEEMGRFILNHLPEIREVIDAALAEISPELAAMPWWDSDADAKAVGA